MFRYLKASLEVLLVVVAVLQCGGIEATNEILVGSATADAGDQNVTVPVSLYNDQAIHGVSISLSFDPGVAILQSVELGAALDAINAEFFQERMDNQEGWLTIGSIFPFSSDPLQLIELVPTVDLPWEIAVLHFDVIPDAPPGDSLLELVPVPSDPPVSNAFSVEGITIVPQLSGGAISINNKNALAIQDTQAIPGSTFQVTALGQHPEPLGGYSIAFTYDKGVLTFVSATYEGTDAQQAIAPLTIETFDAQVDLDFSGELARATVAAILDSAPPFDDQVITASPDTMKSLVRFTFQSIDDPNLLDTFLDLNLNDIDSPTALNNRFVIGTGGFTPDLINGTVEFTAGIFFKRGHINADAKFDISDSVWLLQHLFLGTAQIDCMKAADFNDDGRINIADAVAILSNLFLGTVIPAPPFTDCGIDPTPDTLPCDIPPVCG